MREASSRLAWLMALAATASALAIETAPAQEVITTRPLGLGPLPVPARPTSPETAPPAPPGPLFLLQPSLTLQETYTDNAAFTSVGRRSDWITRGVLDVDAQVNSGRMSLLAHGNFSYDDYSRLSALSGWSVASSGRGEYQILPSRLSMAIQGGVTDGYVSTINTSATDRSGLPNRVEMATYSAGPELTTPVGGIGDLVAAARFAQLFYVTANPSPVTVGVPADDNMVQALASFDTGMRLSRYQSLTTVEFIGDQRRYRAANAIESVFVGVGPSLRLIGRAGYESVSEPGIVNLNAPAVTGGIEYRPNDRSVLTVETGTRFNRGVWAADATLRLSSRLSMNGYYTVVVQPDQVSIANSLNQIVSRVYHLSEPQFPGSYGYNANLYNQTSLMNEAHIDVNYDAGTQSVLVTADWSDRAFLSAAGGHDRTLLGSISYTRHLQPRLEFTLQADYARTFNSPIFGASESYRGSAALTYLMSPLTELKGSYNFVTAHEFSTGGFHVQEHAVVISITRHFF